jgi:hypothetical protein
MPHTRVPLTVDPHSFARSVLYKADILVGVVSGLSAQKLSFGANVT